MKYKHAVPHVERFHTSLIQLLSVLWMRWIITGWTLMRIQLKVGFWPHWKPHGRCISTRIFYSVWSNMKIRIEFNETRYIWNKLSLSRRHDYEYQRAFSMWVWMIRNPGIVDGPPVIRRGQLIFRDPYLQCIPREPVDDVAANWILFSWYTDDSSFPKDKRKMQKLEAAERSWKPYTQKSCWNFYLK